MYLEMKMRLVSLVTHVTLLLVEEIPIAKMEFACVIPDTLEILITNADLNVKLTMIVLQIKYAALNIINV